MTHADKFLFAAFGEILSPKFFTVIGVVVIDTEQNYISCQTKRHFISNITTKITLKKYQTSVFRFLIVNIYQ